MNSSPYRRQVIPNVGLCISLLDIISATEGAVLYGDGCLYYKSRSSYLLRRGASPDQNLQLTLRCQPSSG